MFRDSPDRRRPADLALGLTFAGNLVADCSGYANAGTLANGAAVTAGALSLDGANDILTFPDSASLDLGAAFSVSTWLEPSSPGSTSRFIAGRYVTSGTGRGWAVGWRYDVAGTPLQLLVFSTGNSTQVANYLANATLPTSGWNHCVFVWDANASAGARARFYLNGVEIAVSSVLSDGAYTPFDTGGVTTVGGTGTAASLNSAWKGNLDDFFLFRRALTANEAKQLYYRGRS